MLDMYLHVALRSTSMAVQLGLIQNAEFMLGEQTYCTCLICHPCLCNARQCLIFYALRDNECLTDSVTHRLVICLPDWL